MGFFSKLFGGKEDKADAPVENFLVADMHSHLFPGIDDGVDDWEESLTVIRGLADMGFKKCISTPHIMSDFYRNTPEVIRGKCDELRERLDKEGIDVEVEPAAEYYLDEGFLDLLKKGDMLSFGKNYLLVETNYTNAVASLSQTIFEIKVAGYTPILAHPERYLYMYDDWSQYERLWDDQQVLFQVNLASLVGYYSPMAKTVAEKLIKHGMVNFLGTDIHHSRHLQPLRDAMGTKAYKAAGELGLLNKTLL